jgi:AraC-like DNA-binding protein
VTFAELISKRRLCAAQRLLQLRVLTVHEVAEAMGFADAPAFHKAFKRWSGLTPMQYVSAEN